MDGWGDASDPGATLAPGSPMWGSDEDAGPTLSPGSPIWGSDEDAGPTLAPGSPPDNAPEPTPPRASVMSFDDEEALGLSDAVLRGVYAAGFETPSQIQSTATPALLRGRDVLAQAPSGTGKTAAFLIAAAELCVRAAGQAARGPRVVVLLHTRELAHQTFAVARDLTQYTDLCVELVVGGSGPAARAAPGQTPDIVVATPGKLDRLVERGAMSLESVALLVMDEVDEMLREVNSNAFLAVIERIVSRTPQSGHLGLFSATLPESVQNMVSSMLRDPVRVLVPAKQLTLAGIEQRVVALRESAMKMSAVLDALRSVTSAQSMVFCATRAIADQVATELKKTGAQAEALHGDLDAAARRDTMRRFREGRTSVLVCTLVLARGIDVQQVSLVVLHDIPPDAETYLHCVGRCGRYGRKGVSVALSLAYDEALLRSIERDYGARMVRMVRTALPDAPAGSGW